MAIINFQDIFSPGLSSFGTSLTLSDIIVALLFSLATGLYIFYIYKKTYSGVLYSKNFNTAIVMATMVGTVIIMAIGSNLALSLGMVGALSIIRFRTPVKDAKDITFLFWAVSTGIVNGVRLYALSIISLLAIGAVLLAMSKKISMSNPYIIILKYTSIDQSKVTSALKIYCDKYEVRNTVLDELGVTERTIEARAKDKNIDALLKSLKEIKDVSKVMIFSHTGELSE